MATLLTDNFNSYTDGNLSGQGPWSQGYGNDTFTVQTSGAKEGKCVYINADSENILAAACSAQATGRQTYYVKLSQTNISNGIYTWDAAYPNYNYYWMNNSWNSSGNVQFNNGSSMTTYQAYSANTWYCVEFEWRSSDNKFRYRIDGATYTDWWASWNGQATTGQDVFAFDVSGPLFFDSFAEDPIAEGTNMQINIGDTWKEVSAVKINVGDTWKVVSGAKVNVGDTWKTIF